MRKIIVLCVISVLCSGACSALEPDFAYGTVGAAAWNPALLGPTPHVLQMQADCLKTNVWTNGWTFAQLLEIRNAYLDEATKQYLLDSITGDAYTVGVSHQTGVALALGRLALSTKLKGNVTVGAIDKKLLELMLYGNTLAEFEDYRLEHPFADVAILLDTGLSYAQPIRGLAKKLGWQQFYIGVGLHHLLGLGWVELDVELNVQLDEEFNLTGAGTGQALGSLINRGGGGSGFAMDLGIWGQVTPKLGVGFGLTNLGWVKWKGVEAYQADVTVSGDFSDAAQKLVDEGKTWEELEEEFFAIYHPEKITSEPHSPVVWRTPLTLQAGAHYAFHPRLQVFGSVGYNEAPLKHYALSGGMQLKLPLFPLNVVVDYASYKGTPSLTTTVGLRLWGLEFINLSIADVKLIGGWGKEVKIGVDTALRF